MIDKLEALAARLRRARRGGRAAGLAKDPALYRETMRERSRLAVVDDCYEEYKSVLSSLEGARSIAKDESDPEMRDMAREEAKELEERRAALETKLQDLIAPRDELADKPAIVEIRAGTGGEEAALFAADLFRMYSRFAEKRGWKIEVMETSGTELGGFREIVFSVTGDAVYECLRWESGVHRVQRVPATEASGRIHTSAVTVAVLPEMEETEVEIRDQDLRIDMMRSVGPGRPERQYDGLGRADHAHPHGPRRPLPGREEPAQEQGQGDAAYSARGSSSSRTPSARPSGRPSAGPWSGTGDRSERIRTYNFPQNRITDHRIDLTLYKLELAMEGDIDELVDALVRAAREALMKAETQPSQAPSDRDAPDMTARDALREGAAALEGTETPFLDASLLLADALSIDTTRLLAAGPEPVGEGRLERYRAALASRARGVPVAYILGRKEFWGRVFAVDERVLVPRPDTETLVAEALRIGDAIAKEIDERRRFTTEARRKAGTCLRGEIPSLRVHECCTGSGCVAISVALERPEWQVSASDLSEGALEVARANAAALVPEGRPGGSTVFSRSDLLAEVEGSFDLILANPPYVPSAEARALLELGWSEPLMALDGGEDGLDLVRALAPQAYRSLEPGAALLVEADDAQAAGIAELFRATRLTDIETRFDLGGKARVCSGRKAWTN